MSAQDRGPAVLDGPDHFPLLGGQEMALTVFFSVRPNQVSPGDHTQTSEKTFSALEDRAGNSVSPEIMQAQGQHMLRANYSSTILVCSDKVCSECAQAARRLLSISSIATSLAATQGDSAAGRGRPAAG